MLFFTYRTNFNHIKYYNFYKILCKYFRRIIFI
nr:MAG TPA: hypothetical protein [Bacteriophage sp.]DAX72803.1 MAG TPA: hypothetical protein [Caudoviricetes sp.]